jgi:hypothetical protein
MTMQGHVLTMKTRTFLRQINLGVLSCVDPDFDNDNDTFPPTGECLDHIQPHYRVLEELTQ